jgi:hypothetical protein
MNRENEREKERYPEKPSVVAYIAMSSSDLKLKRAR